MALDAVTYSAFRLADGYTAEANRLRRAAAANPLPGKAAEQRREADRLLRRATQLRDQAWAAHR